MRCKPFKKMRKHYFFDIFLNITIKNTLKVTENL